MKSTNMLTGLSVVSNYFFFLLESGKNKSSGTSSLQEQFVKENKVLYPSMERGTLRHMTSRRCDDDKHGGLVGGLEI